VLTAGLASGGLSLAVPSHRRPDAWAMAGTLLIVAVLVGHSFRHFGPAEFGRYTGSYGADGTGLRRVQAAGPKNALVFVQPGAWTRLHAVLRPQRAVARLRRGIRPSTWATSATGIC